MTARVVYNKSGSDPTTIIWPPNAPAYEQITITSGTPVVAPHLIGYGDGSITFADGRPFPMKTSAGSTFQHQK